MQIGLYENKAVIDKPNLPFQQPIEYISARHLFNYTTDIRNINLEIQRLAD